MKDIENIWSEYKSRIYGFIKKRVSESDADDILQEVFIKINNKIDTLKEHSKLENWFYQIAKNTIIDYYRAKKEIQDLPDWIENDESELIRSELASCMIPLIEQLPEKYKFALTFSEINNNSQKDLAEHENISLSGAKSRIQRGRTLLKSKFLECCNITTDKSNRVISYEKKKGNCNAC